MLALLNPCRSDEIIFERVQENENNLTREINENKKHGLADRAKGLDPQIVAYSKSQTNANGDTFDVLDTDRLMAVSIHTSLMTILAAKPEFRTLKTIQMHRPRGRLRYVRQ
jgi:hypothetical protein